MLETRHKVVVVVVMAPDCGGGEQPPSMKLKFVLR